MRRRSETGKPIASIAWYVGASDSAAGKYTRMVDLSPEPPGVRQPVSDALDPYEGTAGPWLYDDCRNWRKQQHTAMRIVFANVGVDETLSRFSTLRSWAC